MLFSGGMCPLWPLHLVIMYLLALVPLWMVCFGAATAAASRISFDPDKIEQLMEDNTTSVDVEFSDLTPGEYVFRTEAVYDSGYISIDPYYIKFSVAENQTSWREQINVTGGGLGYTGVRVFRVFDYDDDYDSDKETNDDDDDDVEREEIEGGIPVSVVRSNKKLDRIFAYSVATLVGLTYINMGCTLDLKIIAATLLRPVGPAIGVATQYLIMPLTAFGLAMVFFTDPGLRLGIFVTGCSPGGGASNIWTYLLNGNINLSVTMTFVSSLVALGTVPLWVFLLGRFVIADTADVVIPYRNILTIMAALVIPCAIGLLINRFLPKVAAFLKRWLKPWSVILFIFIVAFGIYTNLYIWRLLTFNLLGACTLLPLAGFAGGALASWLTGRSWEDMVAISIETGVQNTGVAIFMLKFSLPEPSSDLSIVAPIVVATMTPVPLFIALIAGRVRRCFAPAEPEKPAAPPTTDGALDTDSDRALMKEDGAGVV